MSEKESIESIEILLNRIEKLLKELDNEKRKNRILKDLIFKIRGLSIGVLNKDNGYFGPRKNYRKQDLYGQFYIIKCILKSNYLFLDHESFIKELLEDIK